MIRVRAGHFVALHAIVGQISLPCSHLTLAQPVAGGYFRELALFIGLAFYSSPFLCCVVSALRPATASVAACVGLACRWVVGRIATESGLNRLVAQYTW